MVWPALHTLDDIPFFVLLMFPFICVFYVGLCVLWFLCGSSKATLRCHTSIFDGIIFVCLLALLFVCWFFFAWFVSYLALNSPELYFSPILNIRLVVVSTNCIFAPIYPHLLVCYSNDLLFCWQFFSLQNLVLSPSPQYRMTCRSHKFSLRSNWQSTQRIPSDIHTSAPLLFTCPILNRYNHVTLLISFHP